MSKQCLDEKVWLAVKSSNVAHFNEAMKANQDYDQNAYSNLVMNLMNLMKKRLEFASLLRWVAPNVISNLESINEKSRYITLLCLAESEFEVKDGRNYKIVNINLKICDCHEWAISSLPCKHAMAVLKTTRWNPTDWVNDYLTTTVMIRKIHPIPDSLTKKANIKNCYTYH